MRVSGGKSTEKEHNNCPFHLRKNINCNAPSSEIWIFFSASALCSRWLHVNKMKFHCLFPSRQTSTAAAAVSVYVCWKFMKISNCWEFIVSSSIKKGISASLGVVMLNSLRFFLWSSVTLFLMPTLDAVGCEVAVAGEKRQQNGPKTLNSPEFIHTQSAAGGGEEKNLYNTKKLHSNNSSKTGECEWTKLALHLNGFPFPQLGQISLPNINGEFLL